MRNADPLSSVDTVYEKLADRQYGLDSVSQLEHALQTAACAVAAAAPPQLVAAALLHDIGHMVHDLGEAPAESGVDDKHQELGARFLDALFGPAVSEPVRLHVAAKRYLVTVEPEYTRKLSRDSVLSLELQGGVLDASSQRAFEAARYATDAVALRRWDDAAKVPGAATPTYRELRPLLENLLLKRDGD